LTNDNLSIENKLKSLEKNNTILITSKSDIEQQIKIVNKEKNEIKNKLREVQDFNDTVKEEKNKIEQKLNELQENHQILYNNKLDIDKQFKETQKELENVKNEKIIIEKELQKFKQSHELLNEDKKKFEETLRLLQTDHNQLIENETKLKNKLESQKQDNEDLQKNEFELERKLQILQQNYENAQMERKRYEEKMQALNNENKTIKIKESELKQKLEVLQQNYDTLQIVNGKLKDSLNSVHQECELVQNGRDELKKQIDSMEDEKITIKKDFDKLSSEYKLLQEENSLLRKTGQELEQSIVQKDQKSKELEKLIEITSSKCEELENTYNQLKEEYNLKKNEYLNFKESSEANQQQLNELLHEKGKHQEEEVKEREVMKNEFTSVINQYEKEISSLQELVLDLEKENNEAEVKNKNLTKEIEEKSNSINNLTNEFKQFKENCQIILENMDNIISIRDQEIENLKLKAHYLEQASEQKEQTLKRTITELEEDLGDQIANNIKEKRKYQRTIESLDNFIDFSEMYIDRLEYSYVEEIHLYYQMLYDEEEISQYTLSTVINVLSDRIYDLEEQLWSSVTEQEYMEASLDLNKEYLLYALSQAEDVKNDAENCRSIYQSLIKWYEQRYSTLSNCIAEKEKIIENLQLDYKKIELENKETQIIHETNKKILSNYENKIRKQKDWEIEKKTMTDELNNLRLNIIKYENEYEEDNKKRNEELNEVNKKIQEEINSLEKELEETNETNEILSKRVMEYELKYDELKQEYLEAIKKLEVAQEKGSISEDEFKHIVDMHDELFGHNNSKQKIKYIDQIKQENLKLKSNNATLSVRNKQLTRQAFALEKELDSFRTIPEGRKKNRHFTRSISSLSEKEKILSPENKSYI